MLWLILIFLLVICCVMLALPLWRQPRNARPASAAISIYRDQLATLAEEQAHGLMSAEDASAAETEIKLRLLKADAQLRTTNQLPVKFRRFLAVALASGAMIASAGLYLITGAPQIAASGPRAAVSDASPTPQQVDAVIADLAARLKAKPDDPQGWRMLGWAYVGTGKYPDAVKAYAEAVRQNPGSVVIKTDYAEAMVMAADGTVTPEAKKIFEQVASAGTRDVRARFYLGLYKEQNGLGKQALDDWIALLKDAPPGADWAKDLRARVETSAARLKIDVSKRLKPASSPSSDQAPAPSAPRN